MNAHALDALQRSSSRIAENAERHIRRSYAAHLGGGQ